MRPAETHGRQRSRRRPVLRGPRGQSAPPSAPHLLPRARQSPGVTAGGSGRVGAGRRGGNTPVIKERKLNSPRHVCVILCKQLNFLLLAPSPLKLLLALKAVRILAGITPIFLCRKMSDKGAWRHRGDWSVQGPPLPCPFSPPSPWPAPPLPPAKLPGAPSEPGGQRSGEPRQGWGMGLSLATLRSPGGGTPGSAVTSEARPRHSHCSASATASEGPPAHPARTRVVSSRRFHSNCSRAGSRFSGLGPRLLLGFAAAWGGGSRK